MTRTERQEEAIMKWRDAGAKGTVIAATGFGKTRIGLEVAKRIPKNCKALVIVPTIYLKSQWENRASSFELSNVDVLVINTAVMEYRQYDLLILDEVHVMAAPTFFRIFEVCTYRWILGLTATYNRLDGREQLLEKYAPPVDEVPIELCLANGWVADFTSYDVIIDVNLREYRKIHQGFLKYSGMFGYDYSLPYKALEQADQVADELGWTIPEVRNAAFNYMKYQSKRRLWINNHPVRVLIANAILSAHKDKRCITFSATNEQANMLDGIPYHTGISVKKRKENMQSFLKGECNTICTSSMLDLGADIEGLEVGIYVSGDSSDRKYTQRLGRVIRKEDGKVGKFYTLVMEGTQDVRWHQRRTNSLSKAIGLEQLLDSLSIDGARRDEILNAALKAYRITKKKKP